MKKVVLTLLAIIVVLGLFAASGYAGYRIGFAQAAQRVTNGNPQTPDLRPFNNPGPRRLPGRNFGFGFGMGRGFRRGFGIMPMMGFGFFGPLMFLGRILLLILVVWFTYWLFTRSGWRLTRQPVETAPAPVKTETVTETKVEETPKNE